MFNKIKYLILLIINRSSTDKNIKIFLGPTTLTPPFIYVNFNSYLSFYLSKKNILFLSNNVHCYLFIYF